MNIFLQIIHGFSKHIFRNTFFLFFLKRVLLYLMRLAIFFSLFEIAERLSLTDVSMTKAPNFNHRLWPKLIKFYPHINITAIFKYIHLFVAILFHWKWFDTATLIKNKIGTLKQAWQVKAPNFNHRLWRKFQKLYPHINIKMVYKYSHLFVAILFHRKWFNTATLIKNKIDTHAMCTRWRPFSLWPPNRNNAP